MWGPTAVPVPRARIWGVTWCDTTNSSVLSLRNTSERTASATCWAPTLPARWHRDRSSSALWHSTEPFWNTAPLQTNWLTCHHLKNICLHLNNNNNESWHPAASRECQQTGGKGKGVDFGWWWRWVWNERINTRTKGSSSHLETSFLPRSILSHYNKSFLDDSLYPGTPPLCSHPLPCPCTAAVR